MFTLCKICLLYTSHIEVNTKGVKNQVIQKIKQIGKLHQKKIINTKEELEMMKIGLINVFNLPITEQTETMNYEDCRRILKEIIEGTHNKPVSKNLSKSIFKWNIPKIEGYNKTSRSSSIMNVPLKYAFSKFDAKVIEVGMDTKEHVVLEELWYKAAVIYITRTEIVMHTRVIRTTSEDEIMDHGLSLIHICYLLIFR